MKWRKKELSRALAAVLCVLYGAVWCYAGILGETTIFGRTALWARCADVLFGLVLLFGAVIWAVRAEKARRERRAEKGGA